MRTLLNTVLVVFALAAMPAIAHAADAAKPVAHKHHHHHMHKQCAQKMHAVPAGTVRSDDDNRAEKWASMTQEEKDLAKMRDSTNGKIIHTKPAAPAKKVIHKKHVVKKIKAETAPAAAK